MNIRKNIKAGVIAVGLSLSMACQNASAKPQNYTLDNDHTHIVWQVDRFGFTQTVGTFTDIQGHLILDEDNPQESSVTATLALSGLRSDLQEREDIVRGVHWLDAETFPKITFTSTKVTLSDDPACKTTCAIVTGEMTLKDVTHPLEMQVRLNKIATDPVSKRKAAGFTATGVFKRSDFGVKIALGPVGDDVSFEIQALAVVED